MDKLAVCIKASLQSFFLPIVSPIYMYTGSLWLQFFPCHYAFPHMLPSAKSYPLLHVKEKLVPRYTAIYLFPLLSLSNFYFSFLLLLLFLLQGHKVSGNASFDGYCLGCESRHHLIAMEVAVPVMSLLYPLGFANSHQNQWGGVGRTAPGTLEAVCQGVSKLCFNIQTVLPN